MFDYVNYNTLCHTCLCLSRSLGYLHTNIKYAVECAYLELPSGGVYDNYVATLI